MKNKKKIVMIGIGILIALGIIVGTSYAWWTHTVSQEGINQIQSTCLEIELADENPISLQNAYPITDAEAKLLAPYTFTITNKCNTILEYDVNLDIMESSQRLNSSYVAIEFNGGDKKLLNTLESVEVSYPGSDYTAVEGRYLTSGELGASESKGYSLKLWMDESVTVSDDAMNKSFISKVVVTAKQSHVVRLADMVELGDYVEMTPTSTSYTIPTSMTGYSADQTINPSELNLWRVIKKNDDGTVEMVSEYTSSTLVYLTGVTGYNNLVSTLQTIAEQYANSNFTIKTRHVGYNNQLSTVSVTAISADTSTATIGCPTYNNQWWQSYDSNAYESYGCGETLYLKDYNLLKEMNLLISKVAGTANNARYFLSSRYTMTSGSGHARDAYYITESGGIHGYDSNCTDLWNNWSHCGFIERSVAAYIRPIVTLKSSVSNIKGNGTKENPYRISINE